MYQRIERERRAATVVKAEAAVLETELVTQS
jgi:hypothetical protein